MRVKKEIVEPYKKLDILSQDAVNKFREDINSSSLFVCSCCHQTWFKHSVQAVAGLNIKSLDAHLLEQVFNRTHFSWGL